MIDRRNPLTARVAVNHIWRRHFGQAIVPTMFDLGNNGHEPTHPALLDWLSAELMEPSWTLGGSNGQPLWRNQAGCTPAWSLKHLHRLIVTSNTYRMASAAEPTALEKDPDNTAFTRMPTRRMEAELVRDGILFVSGRLDLTRGGPELDQHKGFEIPRRSLYFRHAQEKQMLMLKIFDCAAVTECYERKESIVPQQALALMNSDLTLVSSRALARRLHADAELAEDPALVQALFETVIGRSADSGELARCLEFLGQQTSYWSGQAEETEWAESMEDFTRPAEDPTLHARENLAHVLLNHNDFVTIR
jgi:hypothetical protein